MFRLIGGFEVCQTLSACPLGLRFQACRRMVSLLSRLSRAAPCLATFALLSSSVRLFSSLARLSFRRRIV